MWARDYCNEHKREMRLAGLDENCMRILEITRLMNEFDHYAELAEAVRPITSTGRDIEDIRQAVLSTLAAHRDMYLDAQGTPTNESIQGYRASGVPGSVAGMAEALAACGARVAIPASFRVRITSRPAITP